MVCLGSTLEYGFDRLATPPVAEQSAKRKALSRRPKEVDFFLTSPAFSPLRRARVSTRRLPWHARRVLRSEQMRHHGRRVARTCDGAEAAPVEANSQLCDPYVRVLCESLLVVRLEA